MFKSEVKIGEEKIDRGITEGVAQFVVQTDFKALPEAAIEAAKKAFMDCFGVTIAGALDPTGSIVRELVKEMDARPISGVLGGGFRTAPPLAALANGTQAHALDYDDTGAVPLPFHPSVSVFPVALATGEAEKVSGEDLLLSYILGMEVEIKIAAAVKVSHFAHGWHPVATIGTMGATAASAKLLKLNAGQIETALGIASSLACGLKQNAGTMTKPLHAGHAAKNGILAATLAKKGFSAATGILEAPCGFLNVFAGKGEYFLEKILPSLGNPFHFVYPGISLKKYPSSRGTHASIEALAALIKRSEISPQEIKVIECDVPNLSEGDLSLSRPDIRTSLEGKFSIEHCLSVLLLDGEVGLRQFSLERVLDPRVAEMRQKVKVSSRSNLLDEIEKRDSLGAHVTVEFKDGRKISYLHKEGKEEMGASWYWEDVIKKFTQCASLALNKEKIEKLIEYLSHLEKLERSSQLVDIALGPF